MGSYDHARFYPHWMDTPNIPDARQFKNEMDRRGTRMILTCIPPDPADDAEEVSRAIGVPAIVPRMSHMVTIDGSHLDDASAIAFTQELVKEINPLLSK
jgi:hypothetical protein